MQRRIFIAGWTALALAAVAGMAPAAAMDFALVPLAPGLAVL